MHGIASQGLVGASFIYPWLLYYNHINVAILPGACGLPHEVYSFSFQRLLTFLGDVAHVLYIVEDMGLRLNNNRPEKYNMTHFECLWKNIGSSLFPD